MKRALLITLLVATVFTTQAQKVWTLDECINYAIEHNLDLQKTQLTRQQAEYQYKASKNAWLPTLSANAGEYLGFGQSPSYTGVYVSDNSSSTSFGASLSLPLFQGLNFYNTAKADALNLQATEMDQKATQLNLKLNVMAFYMQVLYGKEQVEIARRQVELSAEQLQKTQQLFENGRVAEADVYESRAQLATDQATLTQKETDLALSLLTLTQVLEIEEFEGFEVSSPEAFFAGQKLELDAPQTTITLALQNQPSMEAARLRLQKSHYNLKASKSAWYPSLDFYGGYSNGLYHYFGDTYPNTPVNEQLKRNSRAQLGISLNIPIFNGMRTKYRVKMTEISIADQQLSLENTEKTLRKEIQQAYGNARAAQQKMAAMENSLEASRVAYDYAKAGYDMGKKTLLELNESKIRYHKAESDLLQARYEYLYRCKIIEYYRNAE
ncbi:MAG: TolC family protein [Bacteroidales bacterium]|nr:TolC family protein [Bacteroidales bacterium]